MWFVEGRNPGNKGRSISVVTLEFAKRRGDSGHLIFDSFQQFEVWSSGVRCRHGDDASQIRGFGSAPNRLPFGDCPCGQVGYGSGLLIRRSWVRSPPGAHSTLTIRARAARLRCDSDDSQGAPSLGEVLAFV